jgi:hypothetical protein
VKSLGAVVEHDERRHSVAVDDPRQRHPLAADLLDHAGVRRDVETETAVLPRNQSAEQAERPHARHELARVGVGVLERGGLSHNPAFDEVPDGGDDGRGAAGWIWTHDKPRGARSASGAASLAKGAIQLQGRP